MSSKLFHHCLVAILLAFLMLPTVGQTSDYKVTKVVEVGPSSGAPMLGPLKWSPDGAKLSYFYNDALYISDTLGNYKEIMKFDIPPHRYEWLSNAEIIIHLKEYMSKSGINKLVKVDINERTVSILEQYVRTPGTRETSNPNSFAGPWLSAEGKLYYKKNVLHSTSSPDAKYIEPEPVVFPESSNLQEKNNNTPTQNHFIEWRNDTLYLTTGDLSQRTFVATREQHPVILPPAISSNLDYYMVRSKICNISGTSCILLDTMIINSPQNTHFCGMLHYSFNPRDTEVLFNAIFCEDEENEIYRIGTFNYVSNKLDILDSIIGIEGCMAPEYAPDGMKIAFITNDGTVHIIYREVM